jgi:hypothetical protein
MATAKKIIVDAEKAVDNLWMVVDDTYKYRTAGSPSKIVRTAGSPIGQKSKVQGYISYFLPKDKKGKIIGKPQKMLVLQRMGQSTTEMIPASIVTPYYEYVLNNKMYYKSIGASDLLNEAQRRLSGYPEGALASKFSGANGQYDVLNGEKIDTGSLLNTPLYSNVGGDEEALAKLSDPKVDMVDAETMLKAYKASGAKVAFKNWINSEGGRGIVNEITKFITALNKNTSNGVPFGQTPNTQQPQGQIQPKAETKILGMTPVTFGIVAVGVIALGSVIAYKLINKNK